MSAVREYDAVVVGAGIAGCTAATFLARRGARVAVVERKPDPADHKVVCSHYIHSSALPTIERLGIAEAMYAAGAARSRPQIWTRWGWIRPAVARKGLPPYGVNLRRVKLDPLLRDTAAAAGADMLFGRRVDALVREGGRVAGVEAVARDGDRLTLRAPLVVGADGRDSRVGELAGTEAKVRPHGRFGYMAYYRDAPLDSGEAMKFWLLDPDVAYAFPTDGGLTALACFVHKDRLPEFKPDPEAAMLAMIAPLPGAPDAERATRVGKVTGKLDMPNTSRRAAGPGLAFAGDAAMACDPMWGVGCGFAFQSGEWLADAVAEPLVRRAGLDRALRRYARRHRRGLLLHHLVMSEASTGRRLTPGERFLFAAAARDDAIAGYLEAFGSRNAQPTALMSPRWLARAAAVNVRHALRSRTRPDAASAVGAS